MPDRMIEIVEEGGVRLGADHMKPGERRWLPADLAAEFIRLGWAKDAETGEVGVRVPGAQVLQVHDLNQDSE